MTQEEINNNKLNNQPIFLDIETQHIIQEFEGSWNKKENYNKLKIAVAGVKHNNEYFILKENEINNLIQILNSSKIIVGHNILNFDYPIIQSYFTTDVINNISSKSFDMWNKLYRQTGHMIGLDDLARTNLNIHKNEESIKIPKMWRDGECDRVIQYLKNDLDITEAVYNYGRTNKRLDYYKGTRTVIVDW